MFQKVVRALGRFYALLWSFLLTALLGVAAVVTWHFYQEARLQRQLAAEGKAITVRIERTDRSPRHLWDALGNFVYVGFTHESRPYETRCVSDTAWLAEGDRIALLYHPQRDVFGQPQPAPSPGGTQAVSRLIKWSTITDWPADTKALLLFVLIAAALFFFGGGLLVSLTGLTFIQPIARGVFLAGLGAAALFFTYDAVRYYRYAAGLRRNGQPLEVAVQRADRHAYGRKIRWYTYDATFQFRGQQRVVAIEEADYQRLSSGAKSLAVRYDAAENDFIAAAYSAGFSQLVAPLFLWLLCFLVLRPAASPRAVLPARS